MPTLLFAFLLCLFIELSYPAEWLLQSAGLARGNNTEDVVMLLVVTALLWVGAVEGINTAWPKRPF